MGFENLLKAFEEEDQRQDRVDPLPAGGEVAPRSGFASMLEAEPPSRRFSPLRDGVERASGLSSMLDVDPTKDPDPPDVGTFEIFNLRPKRMAAILAGGAKEGWHALSQSGDIKRQKILDDWENGDFMDRAGFLAQYFSRQPLVSGVEGLKDAGLVLFGGRSDEAKTETARLRAEAAAVNDYLMDNAQSFPETLALTASRSIASSLPGVVVGMATPGGPIPKAIAGAIPMASMVSATSTLRGLDDGMEYELAELKGRLDGVIELGGQFVAFKTLFKESDTLARKIAEFIAVEETTELGITFAQKMVEWGLQRPDEDARTILLEELPHELLLTALSVPLSGGAQASIVHGSQKASDIISPRLEKTAVGIRDTWKKYGPGEAPFTEFSAEMQEVGTELRRAEEDLADTQEALTETDVEDFIDAIGRNVEEIISGAQPGPPRGIILPSQYDERADTKLESMMGAKELGFYSALERGIEQAPRQLREGAKGPQWKQWVQGNAGKLGVKKEELYWSGLDEFLETRGNERVTQEDVLGFLEKNAFAIEEVELSMEQTKVELQEFFENLDDDARLLDYAELQNLEIDFDLADRMLGGEITSEERAQVIASLVQDLDNTSADMLEGVEFAPKFSQYVGRKTDNYREVLIRMPKTKGVLGPEADFLVTGHFDHGNILVHMRAGDLVEIEGSAPSYHIHEIQGDQAQAIRDMGIPAAAPLVSSTEAVTKFALKRAIYDAAQKGYGEITLERGRVIGEGVKGVTEASRFHLQEERSSPGEVSSGKRRLMADGEWTGWFTRLELETFLGEKAAKELWEGSDITFQNPRIIRGQPLVTFYDQMLPNLASQVLKPLGGKVQRGTGTRDPHRIQITPEMREKILGEGFAFYSRRESDFPTTAPSKDLETRMEVARAMPAPLKDVFPENRGEYFEVSNALLEQGRRVNLDGRTPALQVEGVQAGKVYVKMGKSLQNKQFLWNASRYAQRLWTQAGQEQPLFIDFPDTGPSTTFGYAARMVDGDRKGSIIRVGYEAVAYTQRGLGGNQSPERVRGDHKARTQAHFQEVLTHEIGHAVVQEAFVNAPEQIRELIVDEWSKSIGPLSRADQMNVNRLGAEFVTSPVDFMVRWSGRNFTRDAAGKENHNRYLLSFAEWMAQRFSREQQVDPVRRDMIGEYFEGMPETINTYRERAEQLLSEATGGKIKTFETTPVFSAYVNRMSRLENLRLAEQRVQLARDAYAASMAEMAGKPPEAVIVQRYGAWAERMAKHAPKGLRERFQDMDNVIKRGVDTYNWRIKLFGGLQHLADHNPHIQGLTNYLQVVQDAWNAKMRWVAEGDSAIRGYMRLGFEQQNELGRLAAAADLESTTLGRKLTKDEVLGLMEKEGINANEQTLVAMQQMWDLYDAAATEMETRAIRLVNAKTLDPDPTVDAVLKGKQIARIEKDFKAMRNRNYMPHTRFGDYTLELIVGDSGGPIQIDGETFSPGQRVSFETFKSKVARDAAIGEYQRAYPKNIRYEASKIAEQDLGIMQGFPAYLQELLGKELGLTEDQRAQMEQLSLEMSPANSFRKRLMKRKNVAGFSEDAGATFAEYMTRFSNFLMSMEMSENGQGAIQEVRKSSYSGREGEAGVRDTTKRADIANWMQRHYDYLTNPPNEWASLRAFGFLYYLGYSPKAMIVNTTQLPLVTWPALTARFGSVKGTKAMMEAMRDTGQYWQNPNKRYPEGEQEMIDILRHRGRMDQSAAMELAAAREAPYLTQFLAKPNMRGPTATGLKDRGLQAAQRGMARGNYMMRVAAHWGAVPFQMSEQYNRQVSARAAYRLGRGEGMTFEEAVNFADQMVTRTQYEYSRWNRPESFRGKLGSNVFLFYQYVTNTMHFLRMDPGRYRYLAVLIGMSGLSGLPFAENIMNVFDFLFTKGKQWLGLENPKVSSRVWLYEQMADMGEAALNMGIPEMYIPNPDTLMYGASRASPVDLHGSLSMGRIVPGTDFLTTEQRFDVGLSNSLQDVGGAVVNMPLQLALALGSDHPDALRKFEQAMPSFARGMSAAYRYARDGQETTRGGAHVVDFDLSDPAHRREIITRALTFPLSRVSLEREKVFRANDVVAFYEGTRRLALADLAFARDQENDRLQEEAMKAIEKYNRTLPANAKMMSITGEDISRSLTARERAYEMSRERVYRTRSGRELFDETYRIMSSDTEGHQP